MRTLNKNKLVVLFAAMLCLLIAAQVALAKDKRIVKTDDPEKAQKSAEKFMKQVGLDEFMTAPKAPSKDWAKANGGLVEVQLKDDDFNLKKMEGVIKVVAVAKNGKESTMAISDKNKIAKIKKDALEKMLKESGMI